MSRIQAVLFILDVLQLVTSINSTIDGIWNFVELGILLGLSVYLHIQSSNQEDDIYVMAD